MRQLIIALFLVILTAIGSYYLITEKLNLNRYFPPTFIPFPALHEPRPLSSVTPGPRLTALPGFANTPTPKPPAIVHPPSGFVPHPVLKRVPITIGPPAPVVVTPLPAPAYHAVTPLPMVPVYPTVNLGQSPSPSPSPTP